MISSGDFLAGLGFAPDPFQVAAVEALERGQTVVVAAPTGSGKTVVARYAVARALSGGHKAFYTTPLKALSNQKFTELSDEHGAHNVGLLTGDNSINQKAPVVVMTTEVLRNMIYSRSRVLERLRYIVLDEVHYLQDPYRGAVWEEVIIHAPPEADLVCLSATVSNAEELAEWVGAVRGDATAVIEERRPVELRHMYMVGDTPSRRALLLPTFVDGRPNPDAAALDARARAARRPGSRVRPPLYAPRRAEVIEALAEEKMIPAIYFIFSRAGCDEAVRHCLQDGLRLTTPDERRQIRTLTEPHVEGLSDADLRVLGYGPFLAGLEAGFAPHHAGLVPPFKEAVEACFAAALVKAVFATETLSLGINMPARTVVIEKLTKFTGETHETLTPGDYTQLTGRAGRRGIDRLGYAVVLWSRFADFDQVAHLASRRSFELGSSFRPTYNMAANLVQRYPRDEAFHLLNLSFAQFRSDAQVVRAEAELERARRDLEAAASPDDVTRPRPGRGRDIGRAHAAARRRSRLATQVGRLERRLMRESRSLSSQLEQVTALLSDWGYLAGWELTPAGGRLAHIYHEADLAVAESVEQGLFEGLSPAEVAGLASVFTYERRGPGRAPPPRFPGPALAGRWAAVEALWRRLVALEGDHGLEPTRPLDPGFAWSAYRWAEGVSLDKVVGSVEDLSGGDFVRNIRQLVDLLSQLAHVAPDPATADAARAAASQVFRGVVEASSVVGSGRSPTSGVLQP